MNGSSDIILKLFDTLKDSTDKNERTMQTLINQQQTLVDSVTHMPIGEIRQEIKEHVISAKAERGNISDKVDRVESKVAKMIIVVLVSFTILSGGWLYMNNEHDHPPENQKQSQSKP
jgi:exonuclease V gamma subunit